MRTYYIPESIKHTKLVFTAVLLSFGGGSVWDQLLYVITELPTSFLRPFQRFDPLCMGACNVQPPVGLIDWLWQGTSTSYSLVQLRKCKK